MQKLRNRFQNKVRDCQIWSAFLKNKGVISKQDLDILVEADQTCERLLDEGMKHQMYDLTDAGMFITMNSDILNSFRCLQLCRNREQLWCVMSSHLNIGLRDVWEWWQPELSDELHAYIPQYLDLRFEKFLKPNKEDSYVPLHMKWYCFKYIRDCVATIHQSEFSLGFKNKCWFIHTKLTDFFKFEGDKHDNEICLNELRLMFCAIELVKNTLKGMPKIKKDPKINEYLTQDELMKEIKKIDSVREALLVVWDRDQNRRQ
jgi:hypothetical protein